MLVSAATTQHVLTFPRSDSTVIVAVYLKHTAYSLDDFGEMNSPSDYLFLDRATLSIPRRRRRRLRVHEDCHSGAEDGFIFTSTITTGLRHSQRNRVKLVSATATCAKDRPPPRSSPHKGASGGFCTYVNQSRVIGSWTRPSRRSNISLPLLRPGSGDDHLVQRRADATAR